MMDPISYTKNWVPINQFYYRMIDIYKFDFEKNFASNTIVKAFPYGGALAIFQQQSSKINHIFIYLPNGILMANISYDLPGLISIGWSGHETLLCLTVDGIVSEYSLNGTKITDYKINDTKVHVAHIFIGSEETYISLVSTNDFYIVMKGQKMNSEISVNLPLIYSRIETFYSFYNKDIDNVVTIISASDKDLLLLIGEEMEALNLSPGFEWNSVTKICSSFQGHRVALLFDTGNIWGGSYDLKNVLFEIQCDSLPKIDQMAWCGENAIVLSCGGDFNLHGSGDDFYCYQQKSNVRLIPEIDGTRIISHKTYSFLQAIPECLERVYMVKNDVSSCLLEAYSEFELKSYKTIELIEKLSSNIEEAIINLINAAGNEWEIHLQKLLLKAATYGRSFYKIPYKDIFYKTCQNLRIIYNLRNNSFPIPITLPQMLNWNNFAINRSLILRKSFTLAYEICQLKNDEKVTNFVVTSWASNLIEISSKSEDKIADEILKILSINQSVPIISIVNAAIELKKYSLATILVEKNSPPDLIVSTLLKIGNLKKAIEISEKIADPNIIYSIIIHMRNTMIDYDFLLKLSSNPYMSALGVKFLNEFNPDLAGKLLEQEYNIKNIIRYNLKKSENKSNLEKLKILKETSQKINTHGILKITIDHHSHLLEQQMNEESKLKTDPKITGCSIIEAIVNHIENDNFQKALSLKKSFNIPEERFYWASLKAFARIRNYAQIHSLYEAKKNILTPKNYCEILIEEKAPVSDVEKFINLLDTNYEKCEMYIKAKELTKACYIAIQTKNLENIEKVLRACKRGEHDQIIDTLTKLKSQI